jgi:GMP synthase-like glutamine amidotransferase
MADANLLVVDNSLDHGLYRPVEHWTDMVGFSPDAVYVAGGEDLPDVDRYSHIIITGCEGSINEMPDWARTEADWPTEAIEAGAAVLGSCWGHQLIAVALAGQHAVRRAAAPEFGWVNVQVNDDGGLFTSSTLQTFTSHFDEVVPDCHPDMRMLATGPNCQVQAAQWGNRPIWGIQPHPEITPECGREFLNRSLEKWPDAAKHLRAALAGPVLDSGAGKPIARQFLDAPSRLLQGN